MKVRIRIKQLWKISLSIHLLIAFHTHVGLCRPPSRHVDAPFATELWAGDDPLPSDPVRPVYDLRNVGPTEIRIMHPHHHRRLKNNDTLVLYSDKDFIDFVSSAGDAGLVVDGDAPATDDDTDVVRRHRQVVPPEDRNLVRKRRQPERQHRRRRRKHRLVLKARDRNHLSEEEDLKDRRNRFLIKSDSPGYVITSASEVKKDWCRTIPLRQKVTEPNCRSKVIQNNFCYGQCNSFFIPHTGRTDKKVAFQSCAFCKPFKQRWGNVTLNCPGRNPPKIEKTVLFVETCRCITEVFQ